MKDIDQIRRENMQRIVDESASKQAAADRVGMTLAQFLNLLTGAPDSRTGKPRGWLDLDRSSDSAERVLSIFQQLDGPYKLMAEQQLMAVLAYQNAAANGKTNPN
jgi:hypothetical protein